MENETTIDIRELPLNYYSITWRVELLATSHKEAASEALDYIMNGTARVFEITQNTSNHTVLIDLDDNES